MRNVHEHEERLRTLKLSEFYGVDFVSSPQCPTNSLVRKEFPGEEILRDGRTNRFNWVADKITRISTAHFASL